MCVGVYMLTRIAVWYTHLVARDEGLMRRRRGLGNGT